MKQQFQVGDTVKMIPDLKGGVWTAAYVKSVSVRFPHSPKFKQLVYTFELAKFPFRGAPLIAGIERLQLDEEGVKRWQVRKLRGKRNGKK